jgi:hypothetical protein
MVQHCRKCKIELIPENNWYNSFAKSNNKICVGCANKYAAPRSAKWRKTGKGVYGIFFDNKCLYVGRSVKLNDRISQHKQYIKSDIPHNRHYILYDKLKQYSNLEIKILENTSNHKEQEQYWIQKLNPKYNIK